MESRSEWPPKLQFGAKNKDEEEKVVTADNLQERSQRFEDKLLELRLNSGGYHTKLEALMYERPVN